MLGTYRDQRRTINDKQESFIATLRRVGAEPFKAAANGARFAAPGHSKAAVSPAEQVA